MRITIYRIAYSLFLIFIAVAVSYVLLYEECEIMVSDRWTRLLVMLILYISPLYAIYRLLKEWNATNRVFWMGVIAIFYSYAAMVINRRSEAPYLEKYRITYGVVAEIESGRNAGIIVTYRADGEEYYRSFPVPDVGMRSTIRTFHVGDTVILRHSLIRPYISRILKYKPTSSEIADWKEETP